MKSYHFLCRFLFIYLDNERQLAKTETTEKPSKGRKRKNPEPEAAAERPTRQSKRQRADPGASRMSLRRKSKMSEEEEVDVVQVDPQPSKEEEVESKPSAEKVKEEQSGRYFSRLKREGESR